MADKEINTGGGPAVGRDVNTEGGYFVGRDNINNKTTILDGNIVVAILALIIAGIIVISVVIWYAPTRPAFPNVSIPSSPTHVQQTETVTSDSRVTAAIEASAVLSGAIIISIFDGSCLYTDDYPIEENVRTIPCDSGGWSKKRWIFDESTHHIISTSNSKCLHIDDTLIDDNTRIGNKVEVVTCGSSGLTRQQWNYDESTKHIINVFNDECLYVDNYQFSGNVRVVPCNSGVSSGKQWQFE